MNRRDFLARALPATAAGAAFAISPHAAARNAAAPNATARDDKPQANGKPRRFQLHYAPHFGMFRHHAGNDPLDQLRFMADEGFTALEDNGMRNRSTTDQENIARELDRLNMTMGVFVAHASFGDVTFASDSSDARDKILADMRASVEVAKRVNARWTTVVPGRFHPKLQWEYQTANVVENLKRCCDILEPAGLTMVLEPLNPYRDHPGLFLTKIPQAYAICKAVGSPSCKILNDLYHQQVTEGNLIPNLERAWSEIAYFQVGDNPGRKEPTTGEINYNNVFRRISQLGFEGIVGMEHGNSRSGKEGERAVIDAYAHVDSFDA